MTSAKPPGRLIYTQMLNSRGGIECDLTVARLAEDHYYIVTGTGFRTHDFAWIRQNIAPGLDATLTDVTEAFGTLSLMGPRARDVLAAVTDADVSNAAFPFASRARDRDRRRERCGRSASPMSANSAGSCTCRSATPAGSSTALIAAGAPHGIALAGYRAIESLRLEKGYRAWGADITPNDNPFEAGLGWAVKLKSGKPFLGRGATEKIANAPLTQAPDDVHGRRSGGAFSPDAKPSCATARPSAISTSGGWGYTVGSQHRPRLCAQRRRCHRRLSEGRPLRTRGRDRARPGARCTWARSTILPARA